MKKKFEFVKVIQFNWDINIGQIITAIILGLIIYGLTYACVQLLITTQDSELISIYYNANYSSFSCYTAREKYNLCNKAITELKEMFGK